MGDEYRWKTGRRNQEEDQQVSSMEIFYGSYEKSDLNIEPEDTDEFYDLEEEHGCHYVKVDGQLYSFRKIEDIDPFGFILRIEPSEDHRFIAYWYNGGGSLHEVVEQIIKGAPA